MLTRLRLENFKSWQDTGDITLRPITGFFGANSSGKSGLIHALLLLKQTADAADRGIVFSFGGAGARVDAGDFASVVHRHVEDSALGISLDWRTEKPFKIIDTYARREIVSSDDIGFRVVSRMEGAGAREQLVVKEMSYRVGDAEFGMCRASGSRYSTFQQEFGFSVPSSEGQTLRCHRSGKVLRLPRLRACKLPECRVPRRS